MKERYGKELEKLPAGSPIKKRLKATIIIT
jgi:hypothetical protein